MIKKLFYNSVRLLAKAAVRLFYRPIEINGLDNIPKDSPHLIFAPNHQSAFLDAILVAIFSSRPIHFLTRADVFVFPFSYLLKSLNMMPVYRMRDGYRTLSRNEAIFNTCRDLIRAGKPILLFPEASQELVFFLRPLSKGLSRIAYAAQDGFQKPVYIIPVGINYFDQVHGGVKLCLNFGEPIDVMKIMESTNGQVECFNAIRELSFNGMKETLLIPEKTETYESDKAFLSRRYYPYKFGDLKEHIRLGGKAVIPGPSPFGKLMLVVLSLPNLWFHILSFLVIKLFVHDKTFHASIKVSLIMFLLPLGWLLSLYLTASFFGWSLAAIWLFVQMISFYFRQVFLKYWY